MQLGSLPCVFWGIKAKNHSYRGGAAVVPVSHPPKKIGVATESLRTFQVKGKGDTFPHNTRTPMEPGNKQCLKILWFVSRLLLVVRGAGKAGCSCAAYGMPDAPRVGKGIHKDWQ